MGYLFGTILTEQRMQPHHPVMCVESKELKFFEDGTLSCPHAKATPGDVHTQAAINSSIAILIIELAIQK
jgi:hypothetical protein